MTLAMYPPGSAVSVSMSLIPPPYSGLNRLSDFPWLEMVSLAYSPGLEILTLT